MSWFDVEDPRGNWTEARTHEHLPGGYDWWTPGSQPVKTLFDQKNVTISSFFTKLGKFFLSLK